MQISSEARKDRSILWTSVLQLLRGSSRVLLFREFHRFGSNLIIATSSIKDKFVPSVHATFGRNRRHSFDIILEIKKQPGVLYGSKRKI